MMKNKYDLVSIGDCTIDAFVEVEEATTHCNIHHEHCQICFSFADKIPYKNLTLLPAGNANNAAVGGARLGLRTAFYGTVGNDTNGKLIIENLKKENVITGLLSKQDHKQTNFHVVLAFQGERTILIKHQDYRYVLPKGIESTDWIYFTSVGPKGLSLHAPMAKLLKAHPQIKMAFNPGTFQLRMGLKKLIPLFKRTEILFVNKEEAELLMGRDGEVKELAYGLAKYGPRIVVITDGLNGAYALDGEDFYQIGVLPHTPKESTGCGDSFSIAFTAAIMHGLSVAEALRWGGRNGMSVSQFVGPQKGLLTKSFIERDLNKRKSFQAKKLS